MHVRKLIGDLRHQIRQRVKPCVTPAVLYVVNIMSIKFSIVVIMHAPYVVHISTMAAG